MAVKFDAGKAPMSLLSKEFLEEMAQVRGYGAQKYEPHGWKKGMPFSRNISAALRHIMAFNAGEDADPESGLSHLAHAACCLEHVLYIQKVGLNDIYDDRYKRTKDA